MDFNSEAGFLQSSFVEFVKCWSMGTSSTFHVESRNGQAFLNFSAFLGQPRNIHFFPKEKYKNKSERKTQRDNERAALHKAKKNESTSSSSSSTPVKTNCDILDANASDATLNLSNETISVTTQGDEPDIDELYSSSEISCPEVSDDLQFVNSDQNENQGVSSGDKDEIKSHSNDSQADDSASDYDQIQDKHAALVKSLSSQSLTEAQKAACLEAGIGCDHGFPPCSRCYYQHSEKKSLRFKNGKLSK